MNIEQDTVIADTDNRSCIHCKHTFTREELIEDPGVWHATHNFEIECDACVEAKEEYARSLVFDETYGEGNRR